MKQKILDGKFTVEIKNGYLKGNHYTRADDKTAVIKLFAEKPSISLDDVATAIMCCTFGFYGMENVIDFNRFSRLDIYLKIHKGPNMLATYHFLIPIYHTTCEVLSAIAKNIIL